MYVSDQTNSEWNINTPEYAPAPSNGPSLRRSASANLAHWDRTYNAPLGPLLPLGAPDTPPSSRHAHSPPYPDDCYRPLSYAEINDRYARPPPPQQQRPPAQRHAPPPATPPSQRSVREWQVDLHTLPRTRGVARSASSASSSATPRRYDVQGGTSCPAVGVASDAMTYADQHRKFPSSQSLAPDVKAKSKARGLSRVRSFLGFSAGNSSAATPSDTPSSDTPSTALPSSLDDYAGPPQSKRKSSTFSRRRKHSTTEPPPLSTLGPALSASPAPSPNQQQQQQQQQQVTSPQHTGNWAPRLDTCYESVTPQRTRPPTRPSSFSLRRPSQQTTPPSPPPPLPHLHHQQHPNQQQHRRQSSRQTAPPPPAYYSPSHPHPLSPHPVSPHPLTPHPGARAPPAYPGRKSLARHENDGPTTPPRQRTPNFQVYQQQIPQ